MYLALATGHGNVDETAGVQDALVGAALGLLGLLLGLDLYAESTLGCGSKGGSDDLAMEQMIVTSERFVWVGAWSVRREYLPWEWQP